MIENSIYLYLSVNYEIHCALKLCFVLCIMGLGVSIGILPMPMPHVPIDLKLF